MTVITDKQRVVLKKVVTILQENKISFQITGGLAAILYGAHRPLYDIDVDVHKNDILQITQLFKNWIVFEYQHLEDGQFDLYLMTLKIDDVMVDISQIESAYVIDQSGGRIKMNTDITKAKVINWEGLNLPVQNKRELIVYKKILSRNTDLIDVQEMGMD